jgi:hypothetical protein
MSHPGTLLSRLDTFAVRTRFFGRVRRAFMLFWVPLIGVALVASIITAIAQVPIGSLGAMKAVAAVAGSFAFGIATVFWQNGEIYHTSWRQAASLSTIAVAGIFSDQSWLAIVFVAYAAGELAGNAIIKLCTPKLSGNPDKVADPRRQHQFEFYHVRELLRAKRKYYQSDYYPKGPWVASVTEYLIAISVVGMVVGVALSLFHGVLSAVLWNLITDMESWVR